MGSDRAVELGSHSSAMRQEQTLRAGPKANVPWCAQERTSPLPASDPEPTRCEIAAAFAISGKDVPAKGIEPVRLQMATQPVHTAVLTDLRALFDTAPAEDHHWSDQPAVFGATPLLRLVGAALLLQSAFAEDGDQALSR
jgi:hypothetical protein